MPDQPEIVLPDGFEHRSGLYLPTTIRPVLTEPVPAELQFRPDLIVAGRPLGFLDQVFVYATEEVLGFMPTPPGVVVAVTETLPFWPTMRFLSRFQRDLWAAHTDQSGQLALLNLWFAGSEFAARATGWLQQSPQHVLFSEQQLFAFQRLVLLNARDCDVADEFSGNEYALMLAGLVATPGAILADGLPVGEETSDQVDDEEWLQFFIGHGGFVGRDALRNGFGRASRLYDDIASTPTMREHTDYCPISDWLEETCGLGFVELQAFAFALHAGSKMIDNSEPPVLVDDAYFAQTLLADKARAALDVLSAPRSWFADRFGASREDPRRVAYEITPFLKKPALRQPDGKVMPLAPRALEAWMSATGNYYRLFDIARGKGSATRKRFTRFNGALVETYAQQTVERAFPSKAHEIIWLPGTVHRDVPYDVPGGERRTPDVAIDLTPDLVLIEVTSSRLTERTVVDADPDSVRQDIQKIVIDKVAQLGDRIRDLRSGLSMLPGLELANVERMWPIVVASEGLFQTPTLWAHISDAVTAALTQPTVQPLTLLDIEDLEELMGHVVEGLSLVEILRRKTSPAWREMELAMWFRGAGLEAVNSPIAREQLEHAFDVVARQLFGDDVVDERLS